MEKGTGKFRQVEETVLVCDHCGIPLGVDFLIVMDDTWTDGYDTYGGRIEVCSLECLKGVLSSRPDMPDDESVMVTMPAKEFMGFLNQLKSQL